MAEVGKCSDSGHPTHHLLRGYEHTPGRPQRPPKVPKILGQEQRGATALPGLPRWLLAPHGPHPPGPHQHSPGEEHPETPHTRTSACTVQVPGSPESVRSTSGKLNPPAPCSPLLKSKERAYPITAWQRTGSVSGGAPTDCHLLGGTVCRWPAGSLGTPGAMVPLVGRRGQCSRLSRLQDWPA